MYSVWVTRFKWVYIHLSRLMLCMRKHLSSVISHQFIVKTSLSVSGFWSWKICVLLWPLINDLLCSWVTKINKMSKLFVLILQINMSGREPATSLVWFFVCFQAVSVQKTPSEEIWTQPCVHLQLLLTSICVTMLNKINTIQSILQQQQMYFIKNFLHTNSFLLLCDKYSHTVTIQIH